MPTPPRENPSSAKPSGLWARLRGAYQSMATPAEEAPPDALPTWGTAPPAAAVVPELEESAPETTAIPEATPVEAAPTVTFEEEIVEDGTEGKPEQTVPQEDAQHCEFCNALRVGDAKYCPDCGLLFPERAAAPTPTAAPRTLEGRLNGRYELQRKLNTRGAVTRYAGLDHGAGQPSPVTIVEMPYPTPQITELSGSDEAVTSDPLVEAERPSNSSPELEENLPAEWPGLGWELRLLQRAQHHAIPRVLDHFPANEHYYLVETTGQGHVLWDAWEDPSTTQVTRFNWLANLVDAMKALHDAGAIFEGIRPDNVIVTGEGGIAINDLSDLVPMPLPADPSIQATAYTAPELILASETADGRAMLYAFGALFYSLYVGRELSEVDFERDGVPKPFVLQYPDAHPAVARIMMKTFVRDRERRFPTDEAVKEEATGLAELARVLRATGRTLSQGRLDVASWTSTGIARTGNEDAFALIHSAGSKQDEMGERVLAILADGMGGYEAGEIAAALAIDGIRQRVLRDPRFASLTGDSARIDLDLNVHAIEEFFSDVLREVNKEIHQASRKPGQAKRGMGCTAEVVYVDGQRIVVGHVGDSRVYHYTDGRLIQLTRDQTLVNRLVELGQLTPDEAENHPRKNELQQAIGGQPMVDPATYSAAVKPGDWIIVCSDGMPNHVNHLTLTEMIQRADSAEMCARRLINLANVQGGSDNSTVIAIRVT